MKRILPIVFLFSVTAFSTQAQVLNGSFEDWTSYTGSGISGEYPTYWQTSDSLYQALFAPHSAIREGSVTCDQLFALKLTSVSALGNHAPGVATNGRVYSITVIDKGTPDTTRYQRLTGCYQYTGVGTDVGRISAFLLKRNTTSGARDTVATSITTTTTTAGMITFQTDFVYRESFKPDSFLIILQSAPGLGNSTDGSTLIVDNLALSGWVGVDEVANVVKSVKLYPQPAVSELQVETELTGAATAQYAITDVTGKKVLDGTIRSGVQTVDVRSLASGNYLLTMYESTGKQLYSGKFAVTK